MSNIKSQKQKKFFEYKGRPLVRCGDTLYYGKMKDKYVVRIRAKNANVISGLAVSELLDVEMISTDFVDSGSQIAKKTSEKKGLYSALDIATIWLGRALAE